MAEQGLVKQGRPTDAFQFAWVGEQAQQFLAVAVRVFREGNAQQPGDLARAAFVAGRQFSRALACFVLGRDDFLLPGLAFGRLQDGHGRTGLSEACGGVQGVLSMQRGQHGLRGPAVAAPQQRLQGRGPSQRGGEVLRVPEFGVFG